jgi:hypothetical protein
MTEVTMLLVVVAMLALKAAVFIALVIVGVRLAIGAPILPNRERWTRWLGTQSERIRASVSRARHYHGNA